MLYSPERTTSDQHNAAGLAGIEFIEFATFDDAETRALTNIFRALGFIKFAQHRSRQVELYRQGDINLIINHEPDCFGRSFATVHGLSVCALGAR